MSTPHEPVVGPWIRKTRDTVRDAFTDGVTDSVREDKPGMAVFTVHYTYDPSPEQRAQRELYNPAHRGYLRELMTDGIVLAAGKYANEERPGALLIFRGETADDVAARLRIDPYIVHGLVTAADVREWTAALGPWANG